MPMPMPMTAMQKSLSRRAALSAPMAFLVFAGLVILAAATRPSAAHAIIVESSPAAGQTVEGPDFSIVIRYNNRIDWARSRLSVLDEENRSTPLTIAKEGKPDTVMAKATGVGSGRYRLRWQVLSIDGHITRGEVPFKAQSP